MRKSTRMLLVAASAAIFVVPSLPAMAQQPATGVALPGAIGAPVDSSEVELKAAILTFQADTQAARHQYYLWRGSCYYRNPTGKYSPVSPSYCS